MRRQSISVLVMATLFAITSSVFAGSIVAWGDNTLGQGNVPIGDDFVAIAAGTSVNIALRADGSLITELLQN